VGAAASLLLGFSVSFFSYWRATNTVAMEGYFKEPVDKAKSVASTAATYKTNFDSAKKKYAETVLIGNGFIQNVACRDMLLKVTKAINLCYPYDEVRPQEITKRNEVYIDSFECVYKEDLAKWYEEVAKWDTLENEPGAAAPDALAKPAGDGKGAPAGNPSNAATNVAPGAPGAGENKPATDAKTPAAAAPANSPGGAPAKPSGPGWVIQLRGWHYHNDRKDLNQGIVFLRNTILKNLRQQEIALPPKEQFPGGPTMYPVGKLGIGTPVLIGRETIKFDNKLEIDDPEADDQEEAAGGDHGKRKGGKAEADAHPGKKFVDAPVFEFVIQFCWKVPPPDSPALAEADLSRDAAAGNGAGDSAEAAGPVAPPARANVLPNAAADDESGEGSDEVGNAIETPDKSGVSAEDGSDDGAANDNAFDVGEMDEAAMDEGTSNDEAADDAPAGENAPRK
jgi:hypothetical protein